MGFDNGSETNRELDGEAVQSINANLTSGVDLTAAVKLPENLGVAFMGDTKGAPFDIADSLAQEMLTTPNPDGRRNSDVIKPWVNGRDITDRSRNMWIVDFGDVPEDEAALYEAPFEYAKAKVKPQRETSRSTVSSWWLHERPRREMREALESLDKFIVTPRVSKHRLFVWLDKRTLPDSASIAIARGDDYTLGVLHSRFHELWALAMGTQLESRPRYTPTTCFETFPFPEPSEDQRHAIAAAAVRLNELREGWLNPVKDDGQPALSGKALRQRTLTNLYNERPTWLANSHDALDAAVAAAYDWPADLADEQVLEHLLALNYHRARLF